MVTDTLTTPLGVVRVSLETSLGAAFTLFIPHTHTQTNTVLSDQAESGENHNFKIICQEHIAI